MSYFVITSGEDGIDIERFDSEAKLREWIAEETSTDIAPDFRAVFLSKVPKIDRGCFMDAGENPALIIKGEVLVPKPVKVVTEYEV